MVAGHPSRHYAGGSMEPLLLSKSRLNTYCQCPEKFRLTYIEKILVEKTPVALIEGSALHHIVENCLVYGKAVPNMAEEASKEFWSSVQLEATEYSSAEKLEAAERKILSEATRFLEMIGGLNTYQMETYFEHPLVHPATGEVDHSVILRGYADIIDAPAQDITRIIDIKTSAKSPHEEQANRALELTVYAYLMACTFGFQISIPVSFLYLVRTKELKVVWLHSERSMPDFMAAYQEISSIVKAIRHGLFWKNRGLHCGWCMYQKLCFSPQHTA